MLREGAPPAATAIPGRYAPMARITLDVNGKSHTIDADPDMPHPIQAAYVIEQVHQCGYCINGWVMTAAALLNSKKKPTDAEIKDALTGLKCRCGTHVSIMRAVKRAAEQMA